MDLVFEDAALAAVADKAIERAIGARGLRAVMESMLTQIMYEVPSDPTIDKVIITPGCVEGTDTPHLSHDPNKVNHAVKLNGGKAGKEELSGATPASAS